MPGGRGGYALRNKHLFVLGMRELGYMVEQQQETSAMMMGLIVALGEEIEMLRARIAVIEGAQPSSFTG
jgi:hypothetical protein